MSIGKIKKMQNKEEKIESINEEFEKARNAGTTKERWGKTVVEILKKDPKPYSHAEYWECPPKFSCPS